MTRDLAPVSPGGLLEEFLRPLELSQYALVRAQSRAASASTRLHGERAVTGDTDLRLCRFFGLSEGWWLRLQADYDVAQAGADVEVLNRSSPCRVIAMLPECG